MTKPSVAAAQIQKIKQDEIFSASDLLAVEEPLEIRLTFGSEPRRQKSISVTMRTPGNDFELALGFLFTEGIINNFNDVKNIRYCEQIKNNSEIDNVVIVELISGVEVNLKNTERNFYTTSSCGVCGKSSIDAVRVQSPPQENDDIQLHSTLVYELPSILRKHQNVFEYTGGLHASALFDLKGNLIFLREDVGRHNALDKLMGASLKLRMLPLNNHVLLLSGRASFELVQKAVMGGIKIIAAVGAPSSLAVEMAKEFNITLIGFLRDERFNIYSGNERILLPMQKTIHSL